MMLIRNKCRWMSTQSAAVFKTVRIESMDLSAGGCGVAQLLNTSTDGKKTTSTTTTIHVPLAIPGDVVTIKDYPNRKRKRQRRRRRGRTDQYNYRTLQEITSSSSHRVVPKCAHFDYCGGCTLQHVDYEQQLSMKDDWLRTAFLKAAEEHDVFQKMLAPNLEIRPIIGCDETKIYKYRNKMEFTFSSREYFQNQNEPATTTTPTSTSTSTSTIQLPVLGLHPSRQTNSTASRWHDKIVSIDECHLQTTACNDILKYIRHQVCSVEPFGNDNANANANDNEDKHFELSTRLPVYDQTTHEGFMKNLILRTSHNNSDNEVLIEFKTGVPHEDTWTQNLQVLSNDIISQFSNKDIHNIVGIVWTVDEQARRHHEKRKKNEQHEQQLQQEDQGEHVVDTSSAVLLYGKSYYHESIHDLTFRVSQGAFFQPNPQQAEELFAQTLQLIEEADGENNIDNTKTGKTLWDLYCGSATVGLCLSENIQELVGLEINQESVQDAIFNANENNMADKSTFHSIDLNHKDALTLLLELDSLPDVIVVDPPRAGLHPQIVQRLRELATLKSSLKIVYISCNPLTMARDVGMLCKGEDAKLRPRILQGIDMLPHTAHLEAICMLVN